MRAPEDLRVALRAAWAQDTCDDSDVADWSPGNPARGQCGATALVVHDRCGGDLLVAEVLYPDGSQQGWHYWKRAADGTQVDLIREQFTAAEVVQQPQAVERPPWLPQRGAEQYLRLRSRVAYVLDGPPGSRS